MSAPSLADRVALLSADPVWAGHPVVAVVGELVDRLGMLEAENAELRRQLGRHSGNSGQPPSQDGPSAPPRTRRRRRSRGRKPGGQPGHAGTTRRPVAAAPVDVPVDHWPARCDGCGAALPRTAAGASARRQVHDLPVPSPLVVTEHRAHAVCCPDCRVRTRAAFPAAVAGPVPYGPRLAALVAYLRYAQHLPVARLARLLRELYGVSLSTGTVETLCRRVAQHSRARLEELHARARQIPVACMDETGLRVAAGTTWLHVLCNAELTCYRLGARGEVWTDYAGIAVHDRWAAYWTRMPQVDAHALCNAHLLRTLQEIVEQEEYLNYDRRMGEKWVRDLKFIRTTHEKAYLEVAPYVILVFKQAYHIGDDGIRYAHYYYEISTAIACGILVTAIHNAGLATLTSTPLNAGGSLRELLGRPDNEKLMLLLPVGYPADDASVPGIKRKPLEDIMVLK